jgi:molybdate transport system regulatory protein
MVEITERFVLQSIEAAPRRNEERGSMYASARNRFEGTISAVTTGAVNTEVVLDLPGGEVLVAVVTTSSARALGLAPGLRAVGLVKAPAVTLVTEGCRYRFTAGNEFPGEVTRIIPGAVNSTVDLRLRGGHAIRAVVTNDAVVELHLKPGKYATALVNAGQVILGVAA